VQRSASVGRDAYAEILVGSNLENPGTCVSQRGSLYAVSFEQTTIAPRGSNATPTRPGPASTSSGFPSAGSRYNPLMPASASTTCSVPPASKAMPCGRPNPSARLVTAPSAATRNTASYDDSVGAVAYSAPSGPIAR